MNKAGFILIVPMLFFVAFPSWAEKPEYRIFDSEQLRKGRVIWMGTCENCHGYGVADAPIPMKPGHWKERVTKPKSVLYDHAINGYFGPDDSYMPERGGNPSLSDDEVMLAVDYMVRLAEFYIASEEK